MLDFRDLIIGSVKSPCTTSYRLSIESIALNWSLFEKIAFLHFADRQTDIQTDKQMDITDAWSRSLAIASYGLIIKYFAVAKGTTRVRMLSFGIDTAPQSFCHSFSALSMMRCSKSAQKTAAQVYRRFCCHESHTAGSKPILKLLAQWIENWIPRLSVKNN